MTTTADIVDHQSRRGQAALVFSTEHIMTADRPRQAVLLDLAVINRMWLLMTATFLDCMIMHIITVKNTKNITFFLHPLFSLSIPVLVSDPPC